MDQGCIGCGAFVIGMDIVPSQPFRMLGHFPLPVYQCDIRICPGYLSQIGIVAVLPAGGGTVDSNPENMAVRAQIVQKPRVSSSY